MNKSFLSNLLALVALLAPVASAESEPVVPGIVSEHGRIQVAGNRIVGAHGKPVSLAGNSFF